MTLLAQIEPSLSSTDGKETRRDFSTTGTPFSFSALFMTWIPYEGQNSNARAFEKGLAFPLLYFHNGGVKEFLATIKLYVFIARPKLKEHMKYCVDHPEEINKLAKLKAHVIEVKGVMKENIEKVLDRGEKIELLVDKTDNPGDFKQQGTKMRRKMWFQNMKIKLIVAGIV